MAQASLARRAVRRGSQPGPPETAGRGSHPGPPEMAGQGSHPGPPETAGRYGVLLLVLISTYLLSAFSFSKLAGDLQVAAFAAVLLLALRTSRVRRRTARLAGGVALIGSVAAGAADLTGTAACYAAIEHLGSAPFFAGGQPASTQTLQYFSFTTLTTLGYGDFTAAGNGGRAIAVMEALTGQVFLATLVARLVAAFRAPAEQAQPVIGRPRPPRPVRRRSGGSRGKPAGSASRTSRRTRVPPARNHDDL